MLQQEREVADRALALRLAEEQEAAEQEREAMDRALALQLAQEQEACAGDALLNSRTVDELHRAAGMREKRPTNACKEAY